MCDYSLEHVKSRAAAVGDKLVTTQFTGTITRGFASVDDMKTAVCLMPGTELSFDDEIEANIGLFGFKKKLGPHIKTAIFREKNPEQKQAHHDALELPDGRLVLLTQLSIGINATVLQLPANPESLKVRPTGERWHQPRQAELVE